MKNILIITMLLLGTTYSGYAQQAAQPAATYNFSLQDCINYAYQHQDSVLNAGLDVKNAEFKVKETIGTGLPQVNGVASFQDYLRTPTQIGPDFSKIAQGIPFNPNAPLVPFPFGAIQYTNTYSVQATQLLFSGTFLVGLQAAKTYKELSQRNLVRSKIQTNVGVTKAYYQVLVSTEQIKLLDADIAQIKHQLDETTAENKQGSAERIDVQRTQVQYNNLVTNRANSLELLALSYQMLKFQMGMPINTELILTDKLEDVNLDKQLTQNTGDTTFYHNRVEYNLLETNLKLNELDVKSKKAAFLPTLNANGAFANVYQENQTKYLYNHPYPYSYIGISLNVPIFNGGQRKYQLKESQISVMKSQNDLESAKNAFGLEANSARFTFANSLRSLDNQMRNQRLAQEVLRVSKIKYQQGVGSSLEVTQAQTDLESADNQYIQALYNALISKVDMDKAYGRIH